LFSSGVEGLWSWIIKGQATETSEMAWVAPNDCGQVGMGPGKLETQSFMRKVIELKSKTKNPASHTK
jgi:hypothetical protein